MRAESFRHKNADQLLLAGLQILQPAFCYSRYRLSTIKQGLYFFAIITGPLRKVFRAFLGTKAAERHCINRTHKPVTDIALVSSDTMTIPCCTTLHLMKSIKTVQVLATEAWIGTKRLFDVLKI